jgi:hypothetical protein
MGKKKGKQKPKLDYVFVASPAYDGKVHADYAQCLAESAFMAAMMGVRFAASTLGNGAFIELNRNILVKKFLQDKDFTHLFFIDADLKWPYHAFINVVKADRPIVAGVYRRRQEVEDYPAYWLPHPEIKGDNGEDTLWVEDNDWLQCSRVPTGFLCIRRDVVEKMVEPEILKEISAPGSVPGYRYGHPPIVNVHEQPPLPWLFATGYDDDDRFVGEDFYFCDKYMYLYEKGVFKEPISVLADVDFVHDGYKGNWAKHLLKQVDAYHDGHKQQKKKRRLGKRGAA